MALHITIQRQVSILVLLDDAYRLDLPLLFLPGLYVSILVLLDDAYRPHRIEKHRKGRCSFNPCSSG